MEITFFTTITQFLWYQQCNFIRKVITFEILFSIFNLKYLFFLQGKKYLRLLNVYSSSSFWFHGLDYWEISSPYNFSSDEMQSSIITWQIWSFKYVNVWFDAKFYIFLLLMQIMQKIMNCSMELFHIYTLDDKKSTDTKEN